MRQHYMEPQRELAALKKLLDDYAAKGVFDPKLASVIELYNDRIAELEYEVAVAA